MFWLYVCSEDDTICFVERVSLRRSEPVPVGAGAGFLLFSYNPFVESFPSKLPKYSVLLKRRSGLIDNDHSLKLNTRN